MRVYSNVRFSSLMIVNWNDTFKIGYVVIAGKIQFYKVG